MPHKTVTFLANKTSREKWEVMSLFSLGKKKENAVSLDELITIWEVSSGMESILKVLFLPLPSPLNKQTLGQIWNIFWTRDSSCFQVYTLNGAVRRDVNAKIFLAYSGIYIHLFVRSCVLSITSVVKMDFCLESEIISNFTLTWYSYFVLVHHSINSTAME